MRHSVFISAWLLAVSLCATAWGQIFITRPGTFGNSDGSISEYNLDGSEVNHYLVTGLDYPQYLAVLGDKLFVANYAGGTVGEYTTSGTVVNPALISGVPGATGIAISDDGAYLYVADGVHVGKYTISGVPVNTSLVTGFFPEYSIAVSGNDLYVAHDLSKIGKFDATTGAAVAPSFLQAGTAALALSGSDIYSAVGGGAIGKYTTSGMTVNTSFIGGIHSSFGLAVSHGKLFSMQYFGMQDPRVKISEYDAATGVPLHDPLFVASDSYLNSDSVFGLAVSGGNIPEPPTLVLAAMGFVGLANYRGRMIQ